MLSTEGWRLDFDERYPIFRQIVHHFSRSLVRGELGPGERIPSIRDLSLALRVNANTVSRAYQEMERDEMIYSQRGTGYFVVENEQLIGRIRRTMLGETMTRFLEEMRALGIGDAEILGSLKEKLEEGGGRNDAHDNQGT